MNRKINKVLIVVALLVVIAALANITILKAVNVARTNKIEPLLEETKEEPEIQVSEENIEVKEIPTESTEAKSEVSDVEEPIIEVSRVEKSETQAEVEKNTNVQTNNNNSQVPTVETQPVQAVKPTEPAIQQQVKETPVENKNDTRKHGGTEAVSLTSETITVNYLDHYCYVSFARFECELDKCEGFNGNKSTEPIGRRGSEGKVTMKAPKAKEGFKFVRWQKTTDNSGNAPIDVYTAIYEAK